MESLPEPGGTGSVVLDIGGDVGAAVVTAPVSLAGTEVEIRRRGARWDGTHVTVRARHLSDGVVHAAIFQSLTRGGFEVRVRGSGPNGPITAFEVKGGRVTSTQLHGQPTV
jgi:hypothetical protein